MYSRCQRCQLPRSRPLHKKVHGIDLPHGESALLYSVGFVLATGFLHLIGIVIGLICRWALENGELVMEAVGHSGNGRCNS